MILFPPGFRKERANALFLLLVAKGSLCCHKSSLQLRPSTKTPREKLQTEPGTAADGAERSEGPV